MKINKSKEPKIEVEPIIVDWSDLDKTLKNIREAWEKQAEKDRNKNA